MKRVYLIYDKKANATVNAFLAPDVEEFVIKDIKRQLTQPNCQLLQFIDDYELVKGPLIPDSLKPGNIEFSQVCDLSSLVHIEDKKE